MTVVVRAGEEADVEAVLRLWLEAGAAPSSTDDARSVHALIGHDPAALIVAEDDGRIVGSVIAGWDGWRGSIYRLAVAPSHRRRGLGSRLIAAARSRLSDAGAVRLQAIVVATDPVATGFWQASDWERQVHHLRFVTG
ncbi:MAG: GNAT family N-acetyltransferase [Acidimicrobiales bacterium]